MTMKTILLTIFILAQQQNFQIDPLEFTDCLPRWDRKLKPVNPAHRLEDIKHYRALLKTVKTKSERAKLLHRLAVNYYQEYEATKTKEYLVQSIKILQELVRAYPPHAKFGEACLLLGEALWAAQREKEALKVFKTFIRNYPNDPESIRAFTFFAEFFFKKGQYDSAIRMFSKAESFGESEYSYCLCHRVAYCHYKLGNTNEAIEWLNKANEFRKK
jgi:TolA-binding protein